MAQRLQVRQALDILDRNERDAGEILEMILVDIHRSLIGIRMPGSHVLSHYVIYNCKSNSCHSWVSKRLPQEGALEERFFTFQLHLGGDSDAPPYSEVNKESPVSLRDILKLNLEPDLADRDPNDTNHR